MVKVLLAHGADVLHEAEVSHTQQWFIYTHNLIQHSTIDTNHLCTNHVHRVQSLLFTLLPMVDPLIVSSTCCPSLEKGGLQWLGMVQHAFTLQFGVVVSQW